MLKVIFCLRRLPTLTVSEFQTYWFEVHAPLVRRYRERLRIERYVQLHTDHGLLTERLRRFRTSPPPYDGIAEIWYESREALIRLAGDPDARAASRLLREDEKRFVDLQCSPIWVSEEREVLAREALGR